LARINALAIPPAWTDVWISPDASGHIQAIGRDGRRRKQYRYHAKWRESRDQSKYDRLIAFGRALPKLRAQTDKDLARRGLPREKVVAAVVRLLEVTLIRVGNESYARDNKSFGLTTLRKRHAILRSAGAVFEFRGKSGVSHRTGFTDRKLGRVVRACQDIPGQRLFQFVDEDGQKHAVGSADVNAYIRDVIGDEFSAKDFRTWAGTLEALSYLSESGKPASATQTEAMVRECVKVVARRLGNTPAVCRACYIHPKVLEGFRKNQLGDFRSRDPEKRLIALICGEDRRDNEKAGPVRHTEPA
jgi:DNA topoisomerase-1